MDSGRACVKAWRVDQFGEGVGERVCAEWGERGEAEKAF